MADRDVKVTVRITDDGSVFLLDKMGTKLKQISIAADDLGTKGSAGFSKMGASIITLNQAVDFGLRALRGLVTVVNASVGAAAESQRQVNILNQTLRASGQFSTEYSKTLQGIASDLQRVTTFSGETVLAVERQLVPLGLSEKQMRRTSEAVLDLATRLDRSADSVAKLFGRANFEALGRLGIQVDKTASSGEQLNQVLDEVARTAGGSARAATEGLKGSQEQLWNALGDVGKAIGNIVVQSETLPGLYGGITNVLNDLTDQTNEWAAANRSAIDVNIKEFGQGVRTTLTQDIIPFLQDTAHELELINALWEKLKGIVQGGIFGSVGLPVPEDFRGVTSGSSTTAVPPERRAPGFVGRPSFNGRADAASRTAKERDSAIQDAVKQVESRQAQIDAVEIANADALIIRRETQLGLAEDALAVAHQRNASEQEQIQLAALVDQAEQSVLLAKKEQLQVQLEIANNTKDQAAEVPKLTAELEQVDAILARGPQHARELTEEFKQAKEVVFDFGSELSDALTRAVTGKLAGGPKDLLKGIGEAFSTEFIGGLLKAELAKGEFDVMVTDNFTVKLPGVVKTGADLIADVWGQAMSLLGIQTEDAFTGAANSVDDSLRSVQSSVSQTVDTVSGLTRNASGLAGGGNGPTVRDAYGSGFSGAGAADFVANSGATAPAAGGSNFASSIPIAGAIIQLAVAAITGITDALAAAKDVKRAKNFETVTEAQVASAAESALFKGIFGALGLSAIGDPLGKGIGKGVGGLINSLGDQGGGLTIGTLDPLLGILISAGAFNPPTRGSIVRKSVQNIARQADLPEPLIQGGGHSGFRSAGLQLNPTDAARQQFIDLGFPNVDLINSRNPRASKGVLDNITPGVDALRFGPALGIGGILGKDAEDAVTIANNLTNAIGATGVSAGEAERQMRKFADAAGITLIGGLDALNKNAIETGTSAKQFAAEAAGLVKLFQDDLPAGVNASQIAINSMVTTTTGQILIDVDKFTKELSENVAAFSRIPGDVKGFRDTVKGIRFGELNPIQQEESLRRQIGEIDTKLADASLDDVKRIGLLEEQASLANDAVSLAQQRFAPGSLERENAINENIQIIERSADRLDALGKRYEDSATKQATATDKNTEAIEELTSELTKSLSTGAVSLTVNVDGESGAASSPQALRDFLAEFLRSSTGIQIIRDIQATGS